MLLPLSDVDKQRHGKGFHYKLIAVMAVFFHCAVLLSAGDACPTWEISGGGNESDII